MKKHFLILFLFALVTAVSANNVKVEDVKYDKATKKVTFKLSWENAWRQTVDYHDAAWVFCKYKTVNGGRWLHADIKASSSSAAGALETKETSDKLGFFVRFKTDSIGHIAPTEISFEAENIIGLFPDFKVFAIEMVYVPEGEFYAGTTDDINAPNISDKYFYQKSVLTNFSIYEPIHITSENEMKNTFSRTIHNINGNISSNFPKGFGAFYCMKHEVSRAQFVDFLNSIDDAWQREMSIYVGAKRYLFSGFSTTKVPNMRESIYFELDSFGGDQFYSDYNLNGVKNDTGDCVNLPAALPADWLINYLYWSGLTPMTELQFEKASRGPMYPTQYENANGTSVSTLIYAKDVLNMNSEDEKLSKQYAGPLPTISPLRCGFAATSNTNRITSGATFYGILDMSGNMLELTVIADSLNNKFENKSFKADKHVDLSNFIFMYRGGSYGVGGRTDIAYRASDKVSITYPVRNLYSGSGWPALEHSFKGGRGVRKPD